MPELVLKVRPRVEGEAFDLGELAPICPMHKRCDRCARVSAELKPQKAIR